MEKFTAWLKWQFKIGWTEIEHKYACSSGCCGDRYTYVNIETGEIRIEER